MCAPRLCKPRKATRQVRVGDVVVGGGAPISVQSMCTTATEDREATANQIAELHEAGADIVRITIPSEEAVQTLRRLSVTSPVPLVADIHFDAQLALEAMRAGASAIRINPGNIGGMDAAKPIFKAAKAAQIPIRIGVNAGSLDSHIAQDASLTLPEKLAASAKQYVQGAYKLGFDDVVVSAKSHRVFDCVEAYRLLAQEIPDVPLHLGVTEAGDLIQGTVKNSVALASLLQEGIGDTIRISLTANPVHEVQAGHALLAALGLRSERIEFVTCPTCGRTKVDLIQIAGEAKKRLSSIQKPLSVALMGCAVNGPGEAKDADIGVAFGDGKAALFVKGEIVKTVSADVALDELESFIETI